MAQSDFDFLVNSGGAPVSPAGGTDGTSVLNNTLSNPLPASYGDNGRQYSWGAVSSGFETTIVGALNSSLDSGVWVGTPVTHAISVRGSLRVESNGGAGGNKNRMSGLSVKTGVITSGGSASGYHLHLGIFTNGYANPGGDGTLTLTCADENGNNITALEVTIATGLTDAQWHRVRMDVIPNGVGQDVIKIYRNNPMDAVGDETWSLEHTESILSTDGYYCPWGDPSSNRVGYVQNVGNTVGWSVIGMIDGFVAQRESV